MAEYTVRVSTRRRCRGATKGESNLPPWLAANELTRETLLRQNMAPMMSYRILLASMDQV